MFKTPNDSRADAGESVCNVAIDISRQWTSQPARAHKGVDIAACHLAEFNDSRGKGGRVQSVRGSESPSGTRLKALQLLSGVKAYTMLAATAMQHSSALDMRYMWVHARSVERTHACKCV